MKVVIIGGGIAGLTLGILLDRQGLEIVVCERNTSASTKGHAFLMHEDGLAILKELKGNSDVDLPVNTLSTYSLRTPENIWLKDEQLQSWNCIKRVDLMRFLQPLLPASKIKEGRVFSHFLFEGAKAVAAVFANGEVEHGDIFVGADGSNSKVRASLFGPTEFTPVSVKEIVGIANGKGIANSYSQQFTKFQDRTKGLAFGFIPTFDDELVWYIQYDPSLADIQKPSPQELSDFCRELLKDFPPVVSDIFGVNDFTTSYIWYTRDFDLLPSFHKGNVALIGDAAHLALPFTSAGTTSALIDAQTLAAYLIADTDYESAFRKYYQARADIISQQIQLGRNLKKQFLQPPVIEALLTPLINKTQLDKSSASEVNKLEVLYFTDPICSTCWGIQPFLRKMKLEYGECLNIRYIMGGLLPSWENYNKGGKIKQPCDAAHHWEEACLIYDMPLDGDIWLEDPLNSSYTPSIAFKAAQLQSKAKAEHFLRILQELIFMRKKNIANWENIKSAAIKVGLDSEKLIAHINGIGNELFKGDLLFTQENGITSFPTFIFTNSKGQSRMVKGYQPYERYEEEILSLLPDVKKNITDTSALNLFSLYPTLTSKEFAFLSDVTNEEAAKQLQVLFDAGNIKRDESKNGILWISSIYNQL